MKKQLIPVLPFGNLKAIENNDFKSYSEMLYSFAPGMKDLDSIVPNFKTKSFEVNINGLKILSISGTAQYCKILDNQSELYLLVPFYGDAVWNVDGEKIYLHGSKTASLSYHQGFEGKEETNTSWLIIIIDPLKLMQTAYSMLGIENQNKVIDFKLHEPRQLNLEYGHISFYTTFQQLALMIDNYLEQQDMLNNLKIDELFYRNIVMLLRPELFFDSKVILNEKLRINAKYSIKQIKSFIEHHPYEKITLTDLEYITKKSARNIQLMFKKELNITPTQFIREHRLELVNKRLKNKSSKESITNIAMEYGFSNLSLFSKYYKIKFGEKPSDTRNLL